LPLAWRARNDHGSKVMARRPWLEDHGSKILARGGKRITEDAWPYVAG
jgi:hypothetical protein